MHSFMQGIWFGVTYQRAREPQKMLSSGRGMPAGTIRRNASRPNRKPPKQTIRQLCSRYCAVISRMRPDVSLPAVGGDVDVVAGLVKQ